MQAEIFAREAVWGRLLKAALAGGEYLLNTYRKPLEARFPDQVCQAYERIVFQMLQRTSDRATYTTAAGYLRRMVLLGAEARAAEMI